MVKTRSALLKEQMDEPRTAAEEGPLKTHSEIVDTEKPEPSKPNEGSVKTEPAPKASSSHKVSSLSSIAARKKAIELKAAEEKAKIELALIDARLAADIAALEDEARSSRGSVSSVGNYEQRVNNWLQQSAIRKKPEKEVKNVTNEKYIDTYPQLRDTNKLNGGSSHGGGGDNDHGPGTVAPRNITVKDTPQRNTEHPAVGYGELLSRLATSKDLPSYYGDPLEWMQFKQAYIESTTMCNYNDTENMWRLRKCLKGEAKEAVSSLLMGAVTPSVIIETLELQFGRPETVITKIAAQLKKMHPLPQAYHTQIVNFAIKIKNCATAARAMDAMYLNSPELVTTVLSKLPSALITKWADYLFDHRCENKPKMELLADFLFCEATKTATAGISYINVQNNEVYKKPYISHPRALVVSEENSNCKFCRKHQHPLTECKLFKRAMRRDRWRFVKSQRLCYQCLSSKHDREACSAPLCDVCKLPHHKLLHWQKSTTAATGSQPLVSEPEEIVTNTTSTNNPIVLLKTIKVYVNGPNGTIPTHALLDDGATVTLISSELAERAGLHGEKHTMRLRGALNTGEVTCTSERVEFSLSTKSGEKHEITARRIDELHLPTQSNVNISEFDHLRDLQDCLYCGESEIKPQLLIGQDNFHLLVPLEVIMGKKNQPHATHTPLGWCIHGSVCALSCDVTPSAARATCPADESSDVLFLTTNSVSTREPESDLLLHEQVRRYFDFEAIGISLTPRENKLEQQALSTLNKTIKLSENQWEVGLPWKDENATMQESFNCAAKRLRNVEKKMSMSHEYAERYRDRVNHLFDNNYAREVNDDESPIREWYLPHFGVDNPKKKKLRLVFDAAAKSHGYSLNDYLLQGPDLYQSLLGIMFRFREKPIGIIGDIKDMFLRIKIRPEDQHALQFLWRDQNSSKPMKKYAMTSLIFGANCSPFIAQFVKNKNAQRFEKEMPEAVDAILTSHYMDDYIQSHNDEKKCYKDHSRNHLHS